MTDLTPQEMVVAGLISEGMTNPEIAEALQLSINTIKTHLENLCQKLHFDGDQRRVKVARWYLLREKEAS